MEICYWIAVNEQGYLADKTDKILIGNDIASIENWQCVYEEQEIEWSVITWFQDELFVSDQKCVYHIKDVKNSFKSIEKVLELEGGDIRWFPKFFMVGEQLFLFMHQVIYQWTEENKFQKLYQIDGFNAWDFVPVGKNKVAFQVRPKYLERGETKGELTVLNLATLEEVKYPCSYGYVRKWTGNRICVLAVEPTTKIPIIECFDFETNEKKSLKYGALGKDSVQNIYETECGTVIEGSGKHIYLTTQLWEFMKKE